ncbi:MAG: hypothetical protein RLZZ511_2708 [Cyanobacteriota bacterium]|jgi:hypothetical protein
MLRWFGDFEHIVQYVTVKLLVLAILLVVMWILIAQPVPVIPLNGAGYA